MEAGGLRLGSRVASTRMSFLDADGKLLPMLAVSWRALNDTTWEFKLRPGVKFSNGQPFTSKDVLFTICRTLNNETNVS